MTDDQIIALWREHKAVMGFAHALLAAEREACAALLHENSMEEQNPIYRSLLQANAQAIMARGQQ